MIDPAGVTGRNKVLNLDSADLRLSANDAARSRRTDVDAPLTSDAGTDRDEDVMAGVPQATLKFNVRTNSDKIFYRHQGGVPPRRFGFVMGSAVDLVTGPNFVLIHRQQHDMERAFELIFRMTLRRGRGIESWAVFRRLREWTDERDEVDNGCILWHAAWDPRSDREIERWRQGSGPTVKMVVRYVSEAQSLSLGTFFRVLDQVIVDGIAVRERDPSDQPEWREIGFVRWLDWGYVDLNWSEARANLRCESAATATARQIESVLDEPDVRNTKVAQLSLNYDRSPYFPIEPILVPEHET